MSSSNGSLDSLWRKAEEKERIGVSVTDLDKFFAIISAAAEGDGEVEFIESVQTNSGVSKEVRHVIEWRRNGDSHRFYAFTYGPLKAELASKKIPTDHVINLFDH